MIALFVDVEDFVVGFLEGFLRCTCKVSRKFMVFLFASMVILRALDLKISNQSA